MNRLFRGRYLALVATLLAGALVPAFAVRPLGTAESYAVLSGTTVTTNGAITVNDGSVGAVTDINDQAQITFGGTDSPLGTAVEGSAATPAVNSLISAVATLNSQSGTTVTGDLTANNPAMLGAGTYLPGTYIVNGNATIGAGGITLDGTGGQQDVYVFLIRGGTLTVGGPINLVDGVDAGNVYFVAENGAALNAATANGQFLVGDSDTVAGITLADNAVVNGKLLATGAVTFSGDGGAVVNDTVIGSSPVLVVNGPTSIVVNDPGTVNFTVTATDPDPGNLTVSADLSGLPGSPTFPTVTETDGSVTSTFNWNTTMLAPGTYTVEFFATDATGLIDQVNVTIRINAAPVVTSDVSSPLAVCAGDPVSFTITANDPDGDNIVSITNVGEAPAGGDLTTVVPGNPASVTFTLTGPETQALEGQDFDLIFRATDAQGETTDLPFTLEIDTLPTIAINQISPDSGTIVNGAQIVTCVGETLVYDVTAADADATETVLLQVTDLPLGAEHSPNQFGDEDGLNGPDDTLLDLVNPGTTRFTWTPTVADVGSRTLTYTVTDDESDGVSCSRTFSVTLAVTRQPTVGVTANGTTVADGGTVVLCPSNASGPTAPGSTATLTVTGADPDAGNITLERTDSTAFPGTLNPSDFSIVGNPAVQNVGIIAPTEAQLGNGPRTFTLTFQATDALGCFDTHTVTLVVTRAPVVTASTNSFTLCPGQTVNYSVTATDGDPGDTLSVAASPTSVPGLSHSLGLPAVGNPVTVNGAFTAQDSQAGTTINVVYTATDEEGCEGSTTVTFIVEVPDPTLVSLTREPSTPSVPVDTEVCFTARVEDQCGQPVAGETVLFDIEGEPGIDLDFNPPSQGSVGVQGSKGGGFTDVDFVAVTDENGEAVFCYTPRFPTTQAITVTAGLDEDNDGQIDPGEDTLSDSFTVDVPASTAGAVIAGDGAILVGTNTLRNGRTVPVRGFFHLDARSTPAAGRGASTFNIIGRVDLPEGVPGDLRSNFTVRAQRITSVTAVDTPQGRFGSIFGTARTTAYGSVPFRVDVIDAGTPGIARDSYRLSLLTPDGIISLGGTLVTPGRGRNDIRVRFGVSGR